MRTLAILPVKSFPQAKQRLSDELEPVLREALAEAMLTDVLAALAEVSRLDGVLVVTPDPRARELAQQQGAWVTADPGAGHNAAAALGVARALSEDFGRVLLVPGDCPAVDPAELDELLELSAPPPSVIVVPDRHRTGTNALLLTPPDAMEASFGPGSRARHQALAREQGVSSLVVELPSLGLDVDTPEDLDSLARSGRRARHTLELLARC